MILEEGDRVARAYPQHCRHEVRVEPSGALDYVEAFTAGIDVQIMLDGPDGVAFLSEQEAVDMGVPRIWLAIQISRIYEECLVKGLPLL